MSNHLSALLRAWHAEKDTTEWVLGTVYKTEGSAYRKAGAMMLISGHGHQLGLLSGGCLEADIVRNARKVMQTGKALTVVYDGTDEDDISFQLGIGCGGKVYIMLQPVTASDDLGLQAMYDALMARTGGTYVQRIPTRAGEVEAAFTPDETIVEGKSVVQNRDGANWLVTPIVAEPHLLVIGGGIDARPMVRIAKDLGWEVTLVDPRPANARAEFFPGADAILRTMGTDLADYARLRKADAMVVMSHSISLDGQAIADLKDVSLKHVALLGPRHRYFQVMEAAGLTPSDLAWPVSGPAGIPLGGRLPESIALSILSECHAVLHGQQLAGVDQAMAAQ